MPCESDVPGVWGLRRRVLHAQRLIARIDVGRRHAEVVIRSGRIRMRSSRSAPESTPGEGLLAGGTVDDVDGVAGAGATAGVPPCANATSAAATNDGTRQRPLHDGQSGAIAMPSARGPCGHTART